MVVIEILHCNSLIAQMIELLAIMRSLHELKWIQGKELHGKSSHFLLSTSALLGGHSSMEYDCVIMSIGSFILSHR